VPTETRSSVETSEAWLGVAAPRSPLLSQQDRTCGRFVKGLKDSLEARVPRAYQDLESKGRTKFFLH